MHAFTFECKQVINILQILIIFLDAIERYPQQGSYCLLLDSRSYLLVYAHLSGNSGDRKYFVLGKLNCMCVHKDAGCRGMSGMFPQKIGDSKTVSETIFGQKY